jgi:hypothetical protein
MHVLSTFHKDKVRGPCGWTVELYLRLFYIPGEDLLRVVEELSVR